MKSCTPVSSASRGFTLVEVVISVAILTVLMGGAVTLSRSGQQVFQQSVRSGVVDAKVCRVINRIARELNGAGLDTLTPQPTAPDSTEFVNLQEVDGWVAGSTTWSNNFELRLEYEGSELDNGLDEDGDGFVDECRVMFIRDAGTANERRIAIANQVSEFLEGELPNGIDDNGNGLEDERGLCFEVLNNTLVIRITALGRGASGETLTRTLETTVGLRN